MSETNMPAAEAGVAANADERTHYELAFHVLPTVAEGEVSGVFDAIKALITSADGELTDEESPERFDLAYDIVKHLEGKNRKFSSAYFGWVRFKADASAVGDLLEEVESHKDILRHMLIKLSKVEEMHPFRFHEALADEKKVTNVEESSVVPDVTTVAPVEEKATDTDTSTDSEAEASAEAPTAVDESELDKALKKEEA
jgi:ribosomal protein S6